MLSIDEAIARERRKLNKVILIGRLTRDTDVRYSQGDNPIAYQTWQQAVKQKMIRFCVIKCDIMYL